MVDEKKLRDVLDEADKRLAVCLSPFCKNREYKRFYDEIKALIRSSI